MSTQAYRISKRAGQSTQAPPAPLAGSNHIKTPKGAASTGTVRDG